MCIIVVKPKGVQLPSDQTFKNCWDSNYEGFGLAYHGGRMPTVHIKKGAMKYEEALSLIKSVPNPTSKRMLMHFRFATHGLTDSGACHPFPLSKRIRDLRKTDLHTKMAIAHNGVITGYGLNKKVDAGNPELVLSDSQMFIRRVLSQLPKDALYNRVTRFLAHSESGGKLAYLVPGKMWMNGDFTLHQGIWYSNDTFRVKKYRQTTHQTPVRHTGYRSSLAGMTPQEIDLRVMFSALYHESLYALHINDKQYSPIDLCSVCGTKNHAYMSAWGSNICPTCQPQLLRAVKTFRKITSEVTE